MCAFNLFALLLRVKAIFRRTYLVQQFLEFLILGYLNVHVLQEASTKGAAVTSALEQLGRLEIR